VRTYGSVVRRDGEWRITCEPHVMVRLKRVFARVEKKQHGTVRLSDTPENSFELRWFLQRYPMELDVATEVELDQRSVEYERGQMQLAAIVAEGYTPRPFKLAVEPRRYQAVAAELALQTGGLLCADDVGLGKTATAICTLTDPRTRPALVVTLTHLPPQWVSELGKFAPALRVHVLKKGQPYPLPEPFPDVIVCNYHKLSGWADTLSPRIRSLIFDECQELRLSGSQKYAAAEHLAEKAVLRLGLSATPIYNYGGEVFTVLEVLRPGALGSYEEFSREWGGKHVSEPKVFGAYLRDQGLMLRRTRSDVGRELPSLSRVPHHVDADMNALDKVAPTAAELARIILAQGEAQRGDKFRASEELSYLLRQATGVAKAGHVAAFVRLLVESGESVVLYGWHHEVYAIWREALADLKPAFFTGKESQKQKWDARQAFLDGEAKVLVMSFRAGGPLDALQATCRTVVLGELDWSPGVHEQDIGRVHRDGQGDPVVAYFLIAEAGSDPVIADVLGLKRQQSEGVRDPHADLVEELQVDPAHMKRLAAAYLKQEAPAAPVQVALPLKASA